jgi:hypothetical protein
MAQMMPKRGLHLLQLGGLLNPPGLPSMRILCRCAARLEAVLQECQAKGETSSEIGMWIFRRAGLCQARAAGITKHHVLERDP